MGGTSSIFYWVNSEAWNEFVWRKNNKDWESQLFFALNMKKKLPSKGSHNSYKRVGTSQNLPQVSQQGFSKKKNLAKI